MNELKGHSLSVDESKTSSLVYAGNPNDQYGDKTSY